MTELYIGLMSGTSMNAVDAVVVDFTASSIKVVATHSIPLPNELKTALLQVCQPGFNDLNQAVELDVKMGRLFAETCQQLLQKNNLTATQIRAIGSHGQTIRHLPNNHFPSTLQIGDPNIIAELTGITTVADFRRRDVASGGQGAPLVPAFHNYVFRSNERDRVILNIGGIANITLLPANGDACVTGFDTGPGNTLLDAWAKQHLDQECDLNGEWAKSGKIIPELLEPLLADNYFKSPAPKSTGREYFNLNWLNTKLKDSYAAADVQTTLVELTVKTIMQAIDTYSSKNSEIFVCGGGIYNIYLMQRLENLKHAHAIHSTAKLGIAPEWTEATAFAWLARQTMLGLPGNLPEVTGAKFARILGGIYFS